MRPVDVRFWLARVDVAITASTARLEKGVMRLRKDAEQFARDQRIYEESLMLLAGTLPSRRAAIGPPDRQEEDQGRE